jgi:hypothetical protein
MLTVWFQRFLAGLWALPGELGRLPEYATEVERLHREIRAGEERLVASGEMLPPSRIVDTGGGRSAPGR